MQAPKLNYLCGMKKAVGILGISVAAALWCFASMSAADNPSRCLAHAGKPGKAQEVYALSFSCDLFCHPSPPERTVKTFPNGQALSKKNCTGFWALLKQRERLFESRFAQYTAYSAALPVKFRKADIIFPFHYFW